MGAKLKAPNKRAETFRFVIRDEGERTERLDYPKREDAVYAARRGGAGHVRVVTPAGERYDVTVGGSGEPLPSGLQLAFRDVRHPAWRLRSGHHGDSTSTREPAPPPADPGREAAPSPHDPWLT